MDLAMRRSRGSYIFFVHFLLVYKFRTFHVFTLCTRLWVRDNSSNYTGLPCFHEIFRDENEGTDCCARGNCAKGEITRPDTFSTPAIFSERNPVCVSNLVLGAAILFFLLFISWIEDVLVCTRFRMPRRVHAIFVEFYPIVAEAKTPWKGFRFPCERRQVSKSLYRFSRSL